MWAISVLYEEDNTEKGFTIGCDDYTEERILEILREIHPGYKILKIGKKNEGG